MATKTFESKLILADKISLFMSVLITLKVQILLRSTDLGKVFNNKLVA